MPPGAMEARAALAQLHGDMASFLRAVLQLRSNRDFEQAFQALRPAMESSDGHDRLFILADAWAASDPRAALSFLAGVDVPGWRNPYVFAAITQWARVDADGALAWLNRQFSADRLAALGDEQRRLTEQEREYDLVALIRGVARQSPERAEAWMLSLRDTSLRVGAMDYVLQAMWHAGEKRALAWVEALPADDRPLKTGAIRQALRRLIATDPAAARAWAESFTHPGFRQAAVQSLADQWAGTEPRQAAAWAQGLTKAGLRQVAVAETMDRWARQDPAAAEHWLRQLPPSSEWDMAKRRFAWVTRGLNAQNAFEWVAAIESDGLRLETLEQVGRLWISEAPQEAERFIRQSDLFPAEMKQALLDVYDR